MAGKFDPNSFFQQVDNIALRVAAVDLFGFMKRSLDLPGQWAAMVSTTTGDRTIIQPGCLVENGDMEDVLFVRVTPFDVSIEETVSSGDGHKCRAKVRFKLSLVLDRSDLVSFEKEVLGSHRVVQSETIAQYVQPHVRDALLSIARAHEASKLVDASESEAIETAIVDALKEPCFRGGLNLASPPIAEFTSDSYTRVTSARRDTKSRQAAFDLTRQLQDAREKAQTQHLEHVSDLLQKMQELAGRSPGATLPELLKTFTESQRGELYGAMFAATAASSRTQWIVVASGDQLLFFDPNHTEHPKRQFEVIGAAGPVRSVQVVTPESGSTTLWLGGSNGVYRFPLNATTPDLTLLADSASEVRGGFNAVATDGDRVYATHSEKGLCAWSLGDPLQMHHLLEDLTRGAKAVRSVVAFGDDFFCAIDNRVVRWPRGALPTEPSGVYSGSGSTITALCPTSSGLYAGHANGDVLFWSIGRQSHPQRVHTGLGRAVESVSLLQTHGVERLVFADTSLHIHAKVLGDSFVCRYEAGGQTLRRVEVAEDLLVATNDLRDRLIVWTPSEPAAPAATISVSRQTSRSIQDICLVATV